MGGSHSVPMKTHQATSNMDSNRLTNNSNGRLALQKHALHIHAPTCQETESLPVLRNTNCVNLTEINFIVNSTASTDNNPWTDTLFDLAAVNPRLTAISHENLSLLDPSTEVQTNRFLDLLDQNAKIQDTSVVERLRVVQGRLLARVPPKTVRTLYVRAAIPRSGRGRPTNSGGRPWPARETPVYIKLTGSHLSREVWEVVGYGRWTTEQRYLLEPRHAVAVLAHNGIVELKTIPTAVHHAMPRSEKTSEGLEKFWRSFTVARSEPWHGGLHKILDEILASILKEFPILNQREVFDYDCHHTGSDGYNFYSLRSLRLQLPSHHHQGRDLVVLNMHHLSIRELYFVVTGYILLRDLIVE